MTKAEMIALRRFSAGMKLALENEEVVRKLTVLPSVSQAVAALQRLKALTAAYDETTGELRAIMQNLTGINVTHCHPANLGAALLSILRTKQ